MGRISIKDVARAAGVSHGTVSRALSGRGRVAAATRVRIEGVAEQLGYRPDPVMGRLAEYRRRDRRSALAASRVALVTGGPSKEAWRASFNHRAWAAGIEAEAERLGYGMEVAWMPETPLAERQVCQRLYHRGIEGLLLFPRQDEEDLSGVPWERFAVVSLATSFSRPRGLHVSHDRFENVRTAWEGLFALGYRRVGFCIDAQSNARSRGQMLAAHLLEERLRAGRVNAVSPFFEFSLEPDAFSRWLREARPEVVLTPHLDLLRWLRDAGYRVPADIGFAHLNSPPDDPDVSGIDNAGVKVGGSAMRALHQLLLTGQKGLPEFAQSLLHPGVWKPGQTLRTLQ